MEFIRSHITPVLSSLARFTALCYVTSEYGMSMTVCVGPSMLPTMKQDGDVVITQSFTNRVLGRPYQAGDVVICQCPYDPNKTVCKRIVAVEGNVIDPHSDRYHRSQDWSFWKVAGHNNNGIRHSGKMVIPQGHVWLRGDNSKNSRDSRNYGPVSTQLLRGQVICKIFSTFLKPVEPVFSKLPSYESDNEKH